MKFGQLIIRKIITIIANRYHILSLKCTKFDSWRLSVSWMEFNTYRGVGSVHGLHFTSCIDASIRCMICIQRRSWLTVRAFRESKMATSPEKGLMVTV